MDIYYRECYFSGETDPLAAGSPDSFDNDADKLPGGSETDSMAEYGDVDPSKFNEDGSFIGQCNLHAFVIRKCRFYSVCTFGLFTLCH